MVVADRLRFLPSDEAGGSFAVDEGAAPLKIAFISASSAAICSAIARPRLSWSSVGVDVIGCGLADYD